MENSTLEKVCIKKKKKVAASMRKAINHNPKAYQVATLLTMKKEEINPIKETS